MLNILGKTVMNVYESDSSILIEFTDGTKLEISDTCDGFTYDFPNKINVSNYRWINTIKT